MAGGPIRWERPSIFSPEARRFRQAADVARACNTALNLSATQGWGARPERVFKLGLSADRPRRVPQGIRLATRSNEAASLFVHAALNSAEGRHAGHNVQCDAVLDTASRAVGMEAQG